MDYCVRASTRDSPLQRPVTWMLGNRRACEERRGESPQQAAFGPETRELGARVSESRTRRNIGERGRSRTRFGRGHRGRRGDRSPETWELWPCGSRRFVYRQMRHLCQKKLKGSVARLGRRGERNEWRHCKKLCQPAHRSYTSVRRPPSTILRMRGARPPPGLPPGGEAATGAPPALASPGRSREAATVRTHAYPNRQVDRQGRGGGRAPAGHANKQPAGRPQPEPDPYSPSQQTWPALIRCREAARRWSSLSW
jgi:hypothetical protein